LRLLLVFCQVAIDILTALKKTDPQSARCNPARLPAESNGYCPEGGHPALGNSAHPPESLREWLVKYTGIRLLAPRVVGVLLIISLINLLTISVFD